MENVQLSNKSAIALIITSTLSTIILIGDETITHVASSACLVNGIYLTVLALIITYIISLLFKKFQEKDILDISEYLGGKILKTTIGILFLLYFIFSASILLRKISDCLQVIYYPKTNILFIILLFLFATGIICSFKNNGIFKVNSLFYKIFILSIILVFIGNFKNYDIDNIYPIFGNGIKETFLFGITNLFTFSGISYLYFIPPTLQNPKDLKKIYLISILISGLLLIFSLANIVFIHSHTLTTIELFPLYISVRYIEFGTFFQRLDSLFLLIGILITIISISISCILCINIFKKIFGLSSSKPIIYPVLLCLFSISMSINNSSIMQLMESTLSKYFFFAIIIFINLTILIIANIKKKR